MQKDLDYLKKLFKFVCYDNVNYQKATLAQLIEQLICNQQVVGLSPTGGSKKADESKSSAFLFFLY